MKPSDTTAVRSIFNREMADAYDRRNSALAPISDALHLLLRLTLEDLPADARLLACGEGVRLRPASVAPRSGTAGSPMRSEQSLALASEADIQRPHLNLSAVPML